ncbi:type I DNA topoisomerase [Aminirod propionatiphilus]|uniref:Type I DNA topoisomerase n=1 Tax=Aminirod propionatiphilus TaxID=3415223 RepID=A0ACD1DTL7_9BACT|nr:type I DNA topoisomerase [Synergistota bacterium]
MAKKTLVIVESPTKAKTLSKMLGRNYEIKASMGHVRDLPKSRLGVLVEEDFAPEYILVRGKGSVVKELKSRAKGADRILLASDPDREGEAIAWHLAFILGIDPAAACRIRLFEITKQGVKEAVAHPEPIDLRRVDAQQARRVLDRLVGYRLSPLLWNKIRSGLSAGRVQSVALRILCEREREIEAFKEQEYWLVDVEAGKDDRRYRLRLERRDGKALTLTCAEEAEAAERELRRHPLVVVDWKAKESRRTPLPPFKTSTLQQEAGRRLGYAPKRTMAVAQSLYEGVEIPGKGPVGLITYMRTDSLRVSESAQEACRAFIESRWGSDYLPEKANEHKSRGRVQDAHEAIRPTDVTFEPQEIKAHLSREQFQLYDLVWRRFVASQMAAARLSRTTVDVEAGPFGLRQSGVSLLFQGWGLLWSLDFKEGIIDGAERGEVLELLDVARTQKFTRPPSRYTESGLVKLLEDKGVGRPSTYAAIVSTLLDRGYAERGDEKKLVPTELGVVVCDFLVEHFSDLVNTDFTASMEEDLDQVEGGQRQWLDLVRSFWQTFSVDLAKVEELAPPVELPVREIGENCPDCGSPLVIKRGRFGEFIACSGYPQCKYSRPLLKTIGVACPKCKEGEIARRRSKKGRIFYGCSRYPDCDFVSWNEPTSRSCPDCGAFLEKKKKGRKTILSCSACAYSVEEEGEDHGGQA